MRKFQGKRVSPIVQELPVPEKLYDIQEVKKELINIGIDVAPYVGDIASVYEVVTGQSIAGELTERPEEYSPITRALLGAGFLVPMVPTIVKGVLKKNKFYHSPKLRKKFEKIEPEGPYSRQVFVEKGDDLSHFIADQPDVQEIILPDNPKILELPEQQFTNEQLNQFSEKAWEEGYDMIDAGTQYRVVNPNLPRKEIGRPQYKEGELPRTTVQRIPGEWKHTTLGGVTGKKIEKLSIKDRIGAGYVNIDNPGGEWLKYERELAAKGRGGSRTATIRDFELPVDDLLKLEGKMGEHKRLSLDDERVVELAKDIKENGLKWPVFLNVEYNGKTTIAEGNHRVRAAKLLGMKKIPVEIGYFAGGERVGEYSIENLIKKYGF